MLYLEFVAVVVREAVDLSLDVEERHRALDLYPVLGRCVSLLHRQVEHLRDVLPSTVPCVKESKNTLKLRKVVQEAA